MGFHDTVGLALTLECLAWSSAALGEIERAATLRGGAEGAWRVVGATDILMHGRSTRDLLAAQSKPGEDAYETARERGRGLNLEETVAFALREIVPGARTVGKELEQLTPREREVAELVAQGMSNKAIAAKLVISLRTAEGHVERILAKQGFRTRTQVARWFTELQARGLASSTVESEQTRV
ncbi:MAG: helix-turn-helix transcriptional regulator [Nocardioidaceae bacterium]|nr:MAG: helix-turn-helix transcriptional regulator [Nocardioidaceae bacterium]